MSSQRTAAEPRLARHLAWVVAAKIVALTLLWAFFFRTAP